MTAIAIRGVLRPRTAPPLPAHPSAFLVSDTGERLVLPFAPREVEHDGLAEGWGELARQGRKPLVRRTASGLRSMSFEVLLARLDHQQPVEDLIATLVKLAGSDARITVGLSALEVGTWRMSGCKVSTLLRQHGTNAVTRATATLTFLEAVDAVIAVGPISGGASTAPSAPATSASTYTVRAGDTLSGIAQRLLGSAGKWTAIADLNGIRDPGTLKVGQVLKVPAAATAVPTSTTAKANATAKAKTSAKTSSANSTLASGASSKGAAGGSKAV